MGVELRTPDNEPATAEADAVLYRCLDRGLSFKISGGNFLTLTPPLTITDDDMRRALTILDDAISDVEAGA